MTWKPIDTAPKAKRGQPTLVIDLWITDGWGFAYYEPGCFLHRGKWCKWSDDGAHPVETPGIVWASHWRSKGDEPDDAS